MVRINLSTTAISHMSLAIIKALKHWVRVAGSRASGRVQSRPLLSAVTLPRGEGRAGW